jgi:FkbM family methyltransferase
MGKSIRYSPHDVQAWIASRTVGSTSEETNACRRLRINSPLPEHLQREVIRAYRHLGRPIAGTHIDLLGYKISFVNKGQLHFLFNEMYMEAAYWFRASNDCPLIVDCGSNIGMSVLFFKKLYPKARIVAFEPDPLNFETLQRNVIQNNLSDVVLHQIALSNRVGDIELFRHSSLTASTQRKHESSRIIVPARCLSEFISSEIDLLKIDIEGAEEAVMNDLANTGTLRKVKRLHLEYHHHIDPSVNNLSGMLRLLEENGFGYQLRTSPFRWSPEASFQDIGIYCYRK